MGEEEEISFKILVLGNENVGKTSLIIRFCDNRFEPSLLSTTGIDIKTKCIKRGDKKFNLKIFDTAGQERFHSISKNYFKSSDGILLLYDISNEETFKSIKNWVDDIQEALDLADIGFIIVGNKSDLPEEERQVTDFMKEDLEKSLNVKILETSTKDNKNIEECFMMLVDKIYEIRYRVKLNGNEDEKFYKKDTLILDKNSKKKRKHRIKNCCKEK
jgi:small GTP-binding protein